MIKRFLLPLALAFATPAAAEPAVWVVRDADSTIVLFGSVHLLPPGLDWRPDPLDAALKKADDLWFELPIDGAASMEAAHLAMEHGLLPKSETLSARLSDDGKARLQRAAERLKLPMEVLDRMRPWLAEVTIGVAASTTVEEAHRIADVVEERLAQKLGTSEVTVHVEPG